MKIYNINSIHLLLHEPYISPTLRPRPLFNAIDEDLSRSSSQVKRKSVDLLKLFLAHRMSHCVNGEPRAFDRAKVMYVSRFGKRGVPRDSA